MRLGPFGHPLLSLNDAVDCLWRRRHHTCLAKKRELHEVNILCISQFLCLLPHTMDAALVSILQQRAHKT